MQTALKSHRRGQFVAFVDKRDHICPQRVSYKKNTLGINKH